MKETTMEKLELILDEHYKYTKEVAEKMFEELKDRSNNYGELKKSIEIFKKTVFYHHVNVKKTESIFIEIEKMLENEMNDLPTTNRPL